MCSAVVPVVSENKLTGWTDPDKDVWNILSSVQQLNCWNSSLAEYYALKKVCRPYTLFQFRKGPY